MFGRTLDKLALDKIGLDLCSLLCIQTEEEPVIYVLWEKLSALRYER